MPTSTRAPMAAVVMALFASVALWAEQAAVEFDIVSIKENASANSFGGIRRTPDGGLTMTNQPMMSLILTVSPEPVLLQNVVGMPDWMRQERFDVTVKPPAGATREQISQMWKTMWADRMRLVAHLERREQTTFALVLSRSDGRLGPQLKPSALDCQPPPAGAAQAMAPARPPSAGDLQGRCGMGMTGTSMISGGATLDSLARSLSGRAGGPVTNRTGLDGFYALTLTFAPERGGVAPDATDPAAAPDFFTALQEQLGLKLQPERGTVPVFVIDHIERPSPN